MRKFLFILAASGAFAITAHADHTITRRYTDSHCQMHLQYVNVDDEGNEYVESDVIIGSTTPCNGG